MFISTTRRSPLFCFAAGALMALAFAPFDAWPVVLVCVPAFFLALDASTSLRQAALRSFMFGYGYFMAGTWWIANALTVDSEKFGWLIPFCVLGISALLAVYFAIMGMLYHRLKSGRLIPDMLCFVTLWVAVEYLRSIGIFGFPWNLAGYAALASLPVSQLASLVGVFGLSLLVVLGGVMPVLLLRGHSIKIRAMGLGAPLLLLLAALAWGMHAMPADTALGETTLRVVQPNIPQKIKGSTEAARITGRALYDLSQGPQADIAVWPETAYPLPIRGNRITVLKPNYGMLLTGALRVEGEQSPLRVYNSIVAINPSGLLLMAYDKHQLVPFGEFVPMRSVLPLDKITPGALDFSRGSGPQTILLRDLPSFSPLVCYEVIFPWMAVAKNTRPEWMVNTTNDGWYGDSPGPYQHLAMAQMRAIEQGLPLVRAANSGVSAVIDPYGRIVASLALNTQGVLNVRLPAPREKTVYSQNGEMPVILVLLFIFSVFLLCRRKANNK